MQYIINRRLDWLNLPQLHWLSTKKKTDSFSDSESEQSEALSR